MSKEKQIEEMAKDLQKSEHWCFNEHSVDFEIDRKKTAENLYNAGYRKQSENMVEVVRCKDCKHYCLSDFRKPNEPRWCELSRDGEEYPKPNDFCSRGAKMKGGE